MEISYKNFENPLITLKAIRLSGILFDDIRLK